MFYLTSKSYTMLTFCVLNDVYRVSPDLLVITIFTFSDKILY